MKYSRASTLTFRCVAVLALVAGIGVCTSSAMAQQKKVATPPKESFSTKRHGMPPVKTKPPVHMDEEDVADAIMGDTLTTMFEAADGHFHAGEWNHTLGLYKIVEQGDPHNVETYGNSALLLWSTDRGSEAIEQLKAGIAANPDSSYMYDELGTHYWIRLKDAKSAIPYFEKALKYKCGWATYHNLAFCYQKLGQWDKAVIVWKQATKFGDDLRAPALLKQAEAHLK